MRPENCSPSSTAGLRDGEISALAKERGGAWSSSKSHPYLGVVAHLIDAA
jgi:hypothetical protein